MTAEAQGLQQTSPALDATPRRVRLYAKQGCHLCEQAEADLARLQGRYPHELELVDISQDPLLLQEYGLRIPVLLIDGREYEAPLDASDIERALAHAARARPM
jgi:hypothetical protein